MSERAARRLSRDEFLDWCQYQDTSDELVDGVPVAKVAARRAHDRVVVNALGALGNQLDGNRFQAFSDGTAVRIPNGNTRRPDVGVDCGQFDPDALAVEAPRLVLEILSPSTSRFDKLDDYKTVPGLAHIILVDPDAPQAIHWWRGADQTWRHARHEGLDAAIVVPDLAVTLGLRMLYAGLTLRSRRRLWREGDETGEAVG